MVLDIDSFLSQYGNKKEESSKVETDEQKVSLDFQKDVEDKISQKIKESEETKDIKFLKNIYEEIKKFDEDIPNKFFGIEEKGSTALNQISSKYSVEYLKLLTKQKEFYSQDIGKNIETIRNKIQNRDLLNAILEMKMLKEKIGKVPAEIGPEKVKLIMKITETEILLNSELVQYKKSYISEKKKKMLNETLLLNKAIGSSDTQEIRNKVHALYEDINTIPEFLISEFLEEINYVNKMLIYAQNQLLVIEQKIFEEEIKGINIEIEKFHNNYLNKDLQATLINYDKILLSFIKLPDTNLEEKISMYNKITELYNNINKLVVKNNLSLFVGTYQNIEALDEISQYIEHMRKAKICTQENLKIIYDKIEQLPDKFVKEKMEFKRVLGELLKDTKMAQKLEQQNLQTQKKQDENFPSDKMKENSSLNVGEESKKRIIENDIKLNLKVEDKNIKIREELERYFERLKLESEPEKLKMIYRKILFYADILNLKKETREEISSKLKKIISEKTINN